MTPSPSLEPAIRLIGEQLAQLSAGLSPSIFDSRWWSHSAINLAMKDASFKTRLFHFIDVLPVIQDDERVVSLAEEYFGRENSELFGLQWGLKALASTSMGPVSPVKSIRKQIEQMAKTFIAGASIEEAVPALSQLWKDGRAWSVDLLGEATISEQEADRYRDQCLDALNALGQATKTWASLPLLEQDHLGPIPRMQLSLKISALSSRLDPIDPDGSYESVAARLRPLVDLAQSLQAGLIFDMEQAETKDLISAYFQATLRRVGLSSLSLCRTRAAGLSPRNRTGCTGSGCLGANTSCADHDPTGQRRVLGFRHRSISASRLAASAF